MGVPTFFDTSALQHRYIDTPKSRRVRRVISDARAMSYVSTVTILEIASTFGRHCRSNGLSRVDYRRLDRAFWKDIRNETLQLREPRQREYLKALHLLQYAGVDLKRRITSFDALIAASCLELALELSVKVKFYLDDAPLYDVIHRLSAYRSAIDFRFIGTPRA